MAWKYVKNKGWTDGSRVFKRKYIKLNNGDYKSLNSDGTVTLVYTNGKFTKDGQVMTSNKDKEGIRNGFILDANALSSYWRPDNTQKTFTLSDYKINTVNPNSPEGIALQARERSSKAFINLDNKKHNEKLMASENVWDQKAGLALEESRQKLHLTEEGKKSSVMQHVVKKDVESKVNKLKPKTFLITDGIIAKAVSELGTSDPNKILNYYAINHRELYNQWLIHTLGNNKLEKEHNLLQEFKSAATRYNNLINAAFADSKHDNVLTNLNAKFSNQEENRNKTIATNILRYIGEGNINNNWTIHQIRGAGEDRGNGNSHIIDINDDYYKRIYALENGEKKILDLGTDVAATILLSKGLGKVGTSTVKYFGDLLPLLSTQISKIGSSSILNPILRGYDKVLSKVNPSSWNFVPDFSKPYLLFGTDVITYPITHPISTATYATVTPKIYETLEPYTGKRFANFAATATGLSTSAGVRNYFSLGLLNKAAKAGVTNTTGLATTYQNGFFSGLGTNEKQLIISNNIPLINRRLYNLTNPIVEGYSLAIPLSIADEFNMRPYTLVKNATGSDALANISEAALMSTLGNNTRRIIAPKAYSRGVGAENVNLLHESIVRSDPATAGDPISTSISRVANNPVITALARFLPSFWGVRGNYNGNTTVAVNTRKGKQSSAADLKRDRLNAIEYSKGMVPELGTRGVSNVNTESNPGAAKHIGSFMAGSGVSLAEQFPEYAHILNVILPTFSLGRYKPGQKIHLLLSGDALRLNNEIAAGHIKGIAVDDHGNIIEVPLSEAKPLSIEASMPLQRALRIGNEGDFWHVFDTQGSFTIPLRNTSTGRLEYVSADNSGLGHALVKTIENPKDVAQVWEGAFIENNMPQAFNINANGGPSGLGTVSFKDRKPVAQNKSSFTQLAIQLRPMKEGETQKQYKQIIENVAKSLEIDSSAGIYGIKSALNEKNASVHYLPTVEIWNKSRDLPGVSYDAKRTTLAPFWIRTLPSSLLRLFGVSEGYTIPDYLKPIN